MLHSHQGSLAVMIQVVWRLVSSPPQHVGFRSSYIYFKISTFKASYALVGFLLPPRPLPNSTLFFANGA